MIKKRIKKSNIIRREQEHTATFWRNSYELEKQSNTILREKVAYLESQLNKRPKKRIKRVR